VAANKEAAAGGRRGVRYWTGEEGVSTDFASCKPSSVFGAGAGVSPNGHYVELTCWYATEWGYLILFFFYSEG
jgi:glyceraldehyde-3-phosphate dehydrogenase/erythrose-4-phosphate dehydrogenase